MIESLRPATATSARVMRCNCGAGASATFASWRVRARTEIPANDGTCHARPHARSDREAATRVRAASSDLQELTVEEQLKILRALRLTPVRKYDDAIAPE